MTTTTTPVPTRRLPTGASDLPVLSLGSWHIFDRIRFTAGVELIETAMSLGIRHFDVGVYDHTEPGFTDVIFAALVRAAGLRRADYQLSYKLWLSDGSPESYRAQLECALLRGDTDYVEFVVLGDIPLDDAPPLDEVVGALGDLVSAGLIGNWAVNNWSAVTLARTLDLARIQNVPPPVFAQLKYSVARRSIGDGAPFQELFDRGLALEASDVLEGGILAGRSTTDRQIGKDPGGVRSTILANLPDYVSVAHGLGVSPAELAIAFAMSHPSVATTLFGASKPEQLHSAVRGLAVLEELGADLIRRAVEPFWADRGIVDSAS